MLHGACVDELRPPYKGGVPGYACFKLTEHQRREAVKRRDSGDEMLAEIGRSYNVNGATISKLC